MKKINLEDMIQEYYDVLEEQENSASSKQEEADKKALLREAIKVLDTLKLPSMPNPNAGTRWIVTHTNSTNTPMITQGYTDDHTGDNIPVSSRTVPPRLNAPPITATLGDKDSFKGRRRKR